MFFSNILGERFWVFVAAYGLSLVLENRSYWSGYPFPSPEELPNPGNEPRSPALLHADSLLTELQGSPNSLTPYYLFFYDPFVQEMEQLHHECPVDTPLVTRQFRINSCC